MPITVSNAAASIVNTQPDGSGGSIEVTWTASSNVRTDYDIALLKNGVAVSNGHVTKYSPSAINNIYRFPGTALRLGDGTYSARITPSGGSAVTTSGVQFTSAILGPPEKPVSGRNSTDQNPRTSSVAPATEPFRPSDDVKPIFTVASLNDAQINSINKLSTKYGIDTSGQGRQVGPTGLFSDIDGPGGFPFGSVSPTSLSSQAILADKATTTTADLSRKKSGVGGRAEFWIRPVPEKSSGKEGYGLGARIELMPARRSFTQNQGQMIPGVGAGLEIKTKTNLSRIPIPGARPIYQHMGIAEEVISFVGAFVGFDMPTSQGGVSVLDSDTAPKRIGDSWDEAVNVVEQIRSGYELELVMRWNADTATGSGEDLSLDYMPGVRYRGFIRNFVKEFATQQRVYYRIEFVVTNRGTPNLNEKVDAPSLAPKTIANTNLFAKSTGGGTADSSQAEDAQKPLQKSNVDASTDRISVPIHYTQSGKSEINVNYGHGAGGGGATGLDKDGKVVFNLPGSITVINTNGQQVILGGLAAPAMKKAIWGHNGNKVQVLYIDSGTHNDAYGFTNEGYTREEFINRYINPVYSKYGSPERYKEKLDTPPGPGKIVPILGKTDQPLGEQDSTTKPNKPIKPAIAKIYPVNSAPPGLLQEGFHLLGGKSIYVPEFGTYVYNTTITKTDGLEESSVVIRPKSGPFPNGIAYYTYYPGTNNLVLKPSSGTSIPGMSTIYPGISYEQFHKMFNPLSGGN